MKPSERYDWIENYLRQRPNSHVNILDRYFVDAYIEHTNAKHAVMPFGADKCSQLGRDLGKMYADYRLERQSAGLGDMASMMGCKWVWSYSLL